MESLAGKLAGARARLTAAGIAPDEAAIDVELYARTLMAWGRERLIVEQAGPVPHGLEPEFSAWIERRVRQEPSAYIVGTREFYGLDFHVTPAVLIPRPETELLVEEALALISATSDTAVADIGTGSGCLGITLAHEAGRSRVLATDVSPAALEVARVNARRLGVSKRVTFLETRYLDGVTSAFDLIVANPPYVRDADRQALPGPVRHEPDLALFGGADGLRDLAGVLDAALRTLRSGGWCLMEFGAGQDADVERLVAARCPLRLERIRADLRGIPRIAIIQRP